MKLFMLLLGCKPPDRHTEQHDIFFGIGNSPKDLISDILSFWPGPEKIHVDAWREVTLVDGYSIEVVNRNYVNPDADSLKLFFINLGGYQQGLFDEPHYKVLTVQPNQAAAIKAAKNTYFFSRYRFAGAESHVDDKYGLDVDDLYAVEEILPIDQKEKYRLKITATDRITTDEIHLGYFKLDKLP